MADIRLEKIYKKYDLDTLGVEDISLEMKDGSLTTFVGMAGSGKSTVFHLIGGIVDVTSGEVYFDGVPVTNLPPKKRDVCLMRAGYNAVSGSVYDNVSYGLRLRGLPRAEVYRRTAEAIKLVGLNGKEKVKMKKLTELERRLTSLARGVARKPAVFLIDEPYFNVSDEDRLEIAKAIKRVHDNGLTIIIADSFGHNAFLCGGRVVVFRDGRVIQTGDEKSLNAQPLNMFVASYLGENPMSFIEREEDIIGFRSNDCSVGEGEYEGKVESEENGVLTVRIKDGEPPVRVSGKGNIGDKIRFEIHTFVRFCKEDGRLLK
ncbi:MAG: ABC transporter ATP-binding protein [Clostridia bacterium]|nr:ABC transporter ATP-binding protein [Clostridia bacterium]